MELPLELLPGVPAVKYRAIPGYELYAAGSDGTIWSYCRGRKWKRLQPGVTRWGYLIVVLTTGGREGRKTSVVHQLILKTFIGPRPDGMETRHLDGNSRNNHIDNLRYGTKTENAEDTKRHGRLHGIRCGERNPNAKLSSEQVRHIRRLSSEGLNCGEILRTGLFPVGVGTLQGIVGNHIWLDVK